MAAMDDRDETTTTETPFKASAGRRGRRVVRYVLAFVTVVLLIDAVVGDKGLLALLEARRQYDALELALRRARAENAELREDARRLREDPAAIEELARRDLGLIKPGEKLFIVRDVKPPSHK
ncbi:MAG: septum formation initiator family protein [Vicinamibacterales bacterium]